VRVPKIEAGRETSWPEGRPLPRFTPDDVPHADDGVRTNALVRWFDPARGFGFVAPHDGSPNAFLHISVLNRAGLHDVADGTEIVCRIAPGGRGPQVIEVVEVLGRAAPATAPAHGRAPAGPSVEATGTVKWYKADKGFGFVVADDGGADVFVHKSVLRRCGVDGLVPNQRLHLRVQETAKGREATWVTAL